MGLTLHLTLLSWRIKVLIHQRCASGLNIIINLFDVLLICYISVADLTDIDIEKTTLDPTLFPGVSSSVEVHEGFANEQAKCVVVSNFLYSGTQIKRIGADYMVTQDCE